MDPITQGALGAALPQAAANGKKIVAASIIGALAGIAPDLDVLIRSSTDPLLFLEFHRQFTHSLFFIPVGGALCGLILHYLFAKRFALRLSQSLCFATLGYATHALLDACTTFGTQLLWPLSSMRVAWNNVSVIDPFFTLPLIICIGIGYFKQNPLFARVGLVWAVGYLMLGVLQRDRAEAAGWEMAEQRGHTPIRLEAKPTLGNLWLWKIVYETATDFHVDAAHVLFKATYYPGQAIKKLAINEDFPWLALNSQQALDVNRFRWFSNNYLAVDAHNPNRIIDVRYSIVPNHVQPLWGIELNPNATADQHVEYFAERETGPSVRAQFFNLLLGQDQAPVKGAIER